mgnify:CR=1 FL=1
MKKLTAILVVACLLMMAGCAAQKDDPISSKSTGVAETTKAIENEATSESVETTESEASSELMIIEDVFSVENHGVIVTGVISHGTINTDDVITVNGETYTVFMIDAVDPDTNTPGNVDSASEGMSVALHLSTMDSSPFAQGDVVEIGE